jgi:4-amino-4-deoxy-L-arabinose transferase-like glycosyltransferase
MKKLNWWLIAIISLAAILRLPYLNTHMPSLYGDEIAIGYNAFSILKTGRDEFGKFMPLQFQSWGDQKNPVYIYAVAAVQFFTGATPTSVRLPSALAGIFAVYLTYRLVILLGMGEGPALLSGLLLALTPWHIHISRGGYEANLALTLGLASVVALLTWFKSGRRRQLVLSILYLVIATYTYYTTKMFGPLLLAFIWFWGWCYFRSRKKIKLSHLLSYWGLAFVLALPLFYLAIFANGQARFAAINIFTDKTAATRVIRDRNFFPDSKSLMAKVMENTTVYHFLDFTSYYFDNFSGQFLFVGGDSNVRYGLANHGMLYLIDAPLILMGIILLYHKNKKAWLFLVAWLLLAPLPTSLVGKAYGLRSLAMLPIPQIFAAFALYQLYLWSKLSKIRTGILLLTSTLYLLSVSNWLVRYIYQYPSYGRYWYDSAMLESIQYADAHAAKYDQVIITQTYGETSMYYAYYHQIDPRVYEAAKANRIMMDGIPMVHLGKYYFGDLRPNGKLEDMQLPPHTLIITDPLSPYSEEAINARDDGRAIFQVYEFPTHYMQSLKK